MTHYEVLTSDVQNAHRRASSGISLRHSGHLRVVGSAGGSRRAREMRALTGATTKKKTTAAITTNVMTLLTKSPYLNVLPWILRSKAEKSAWPPMAAMRV